MTTTTITKGDALYPAGLLALGDDAPETLRVSGNVDVLAKMHTSIAITGGRASTGYGEHVTMELTKGLLERMPNLVVANGGAYGIDGMAIRTALAENATPLVWLAGGVTRFYPSGHDTLFNRVLDIGGVIVSAEDDQASPTKWRFLQRNNYLAAITSATLITEAGWRSGSLHTAYSAHKLGKSVMAVPGPITSASSAGCHRLITERVADLVTSQSGVFLTCG